MRSLLLVYSRNHHSVITFLILLAVPCVCSGYGNLQFRDDNGNVVNSLWDQRSYESEIFPDGIPWLLNRETAVFPIYSCEQILTDLFDPSYGVVALGDMDGDGDLDMISGGARLYLNNGTRDPWKGVMSIVFTGSTSIATGDVDGDGDLDVVLGRRYGTSVLYLNNGTRNPFEGVDAIAITPVKKTPHWTNAVALGDVDGGSDLDMVEGNRNYPNRLYLNNGTSNPWGGIEGVDITSDAHDTFAIALGDVDGDGDLDIVAGNCNETNRLYLNNGTRNPFSGVSGIDITSDTHHTAAIAMGDIDGDGDMDLVAGNRERQANRFYLNNGTSNPWRGIRGLDFGSQMNRTYSIVLADMNQDGHLDLVEGNLRQANRYYLNNGTDRPWSGNDGIRLYDDRYSTQGIAVGDVDSDGQLDVVAGDGGPDHFYRIASTIDMQAIVDSAFETWEAVSESKIAFTCSGLTGSRPPGDDPPLEAPHFPALDGDNVIGFSDSIEGVLATTYIFTLSNECTFDDSGRNPDTDFGGTDPSPDIPQGTYPAGTILDADIVLSGTNWTITGEAGKIDLESVLVHEIGHFIGLCHSTVEHPIPAMMYPFLNGPEACQRKSLGADDIAGVRACYPTDMSLQNFGSVHGTVTRVSDGTRIAGAHVVARSLTSASQVIGCYTNSDGSYVLQGLSPGDHTIRVEPLICEPEWINEIIAEEYGSPFQLQAYPCEYDESSATVLHLAAGGTIENIDFQVVSIDGSDPFEPDDTFDCASLIATTGAALFKTLYPPSNVDFIEFEAMEGKNYIITTFGTPPFGGYTRQFSLYLYGPNKKLLLAQNCIPNAWINFHAEINGPHYLKIRIRPLSPPSAGSLYPSPDGAPYALSVRERDPVVYYVSANTGADPAVVSPAQEPYRLKNGDTLCVSLDQTSMQTVTFTASQFQNIQAATAEEVADVINSQITGGLAKAIYNETGVSLSVTSTSKPPASIQVLGGKAAAALGFDTNLHGAADGSCESPWASIGYALLCVSPDLMSPADLYIADGTYYERIVTVPRVGLYGGFDPSDWSRNLDTHNTIMHGGYQGSTVVGRGVCQIEGLIVTGGKGTYAPPYMHGDHQYVGGGIYVSGFANAPIVSKCLLCDNSIERSGYRTLGGGIFIGDQSSSSVTDCEIAGNSADIGGGVALEECYALILDNYVHKNQAVSVYPSSGISGSGGGLFSNTLHYYMGSEITGNTFTQNSAANRAGAMGGHNNCWDFLSGNVFACNFADSDGGALSFYGWGGGASDVKGNIIASNLSGRNGGGIYVDGFDNHLEENLLIGNIAYNNGGGIYKKYEGRGRVVNNVFCGNDAKEGGGFFANIFISRGGFLHNTVVYNTGLSGGGLANGRSVRWPTGQSWAGTWVCNNIIAFNIGGGLVENVDMPDPGLFANNDFFSNSIGGRPQVGNYYDADTARWYNSAAEINALVDNGSGEVRDNVDWSPGFEPAPDGIAGNIIYDAITYQSILVDDSATFVPNALAGLTLNPDTSQRLHFYIVSNTETTITTWGDMTAVATRPCTYQVFDYHIASDSRNIGAGIEVDVENDIDGDPRPLGNGFDIGVDEYSRVLVDGFTSIYSTSKK